MAKAAQASGAVAPRAGLSRSGDPPRDALTAPTAIVGPALHRHHAGLAASVKRLADVAQVAEAGALTMRGELRVRLGQHRHAQVGRQTIDRQTTALAFAPRDPTDPTRRGAGTVTEQALLTLQA